MQVEGVKSGAHRGAEDVPVPALYRTEEFGDITGREPVTAQPVKNRAQGFIDSVTEAWYVATVDRMARVFSTQPIRRGSCSIDEHCLRRECKTLRVVRLSTTAAGNPNVPSVIETRRQVHLLQGQ